MQEKWKRRGGAHALANRNVSTGQHNTDLLLVGDGVEHDLQGEFTAELLERLSIGSPRKGSSPRGSPIAEQE